MAKKPQKSELTKVDKLGGFSPREMYAKWLAFPSTLRRISSDDFEKLGIDSSEVSDLLMIKTRVEFAKAIGMSRSQLYKYEDEKEFQELRYKYLKEWGVDRTPAMIMALYRKALAEGDAGRVKLWMQIFHDFTEKSETKHTVDTEEIKRLTSVIQGFLKK